MEKSPQTPHPEDKSSMVISSPEQLGFATCPPGSEVLKARVEKVGDDFSVLTNVIS